MNRRIHDGLLRRLTAAILLTSFGAAHAAPELAHATYSPGGRTSAGGGLTLDSSIEPWGAAGATGDHIVRPGFSGRLYDVQTLEVGVQAPAVPEENAVEFDVAGRCDDATVLPAETEAWSIVAGPIAALGGTGHALTAAVYQEETGVVEAVAFGLTARGQVRVLDQDPDNFGLYAHDEVQDRWQVGYFGPDSTNGLAGADPDGDADDNFYEFIAGTDPLSPQSAFRVDIARSGGLRVSGSPANTNRTYHLQQTANLKSGVWSPVAEGSGYFSNGQWSVSGLSGTNPLSQYRMAIEYNWR